MLNPETIRARILGALPDASVEVVDLTGTGDHFEARVVSASFEGKSMVEQHKEVYAPLQDLLRSGQLHALSVKTFNSKPR